MLRLLVGKKVNNLSSCLFSSVDRWSVLSFRFTRKLFCPDRAGWSHSCFNSVCVIFGDIDTHLRSTFVRYGDRMGLRCTSTLLLPHRHRLCGLVYRIKQGNKNHHIALERRDGFLIVESYIQIYI